VALLPSCKVRRVPCPPQVPARARGARGASAESDETLKVGSVVCGRAGAVRPPHGTHAAHLLPGSHGCATPHTPQKRTDELEAANRKLEAVCEDLEDKATAAQARAQQLVAELEVGEGEARRHRIAAFAAAAAGGGRRRRSLQHLISSHALWTGWQGAHPGP
jgi:hypothetical protein